MLLAAGVVLAGAAAAHLPAEEVRDARGARLGHAADPTHVPQEGDTSAAAVIVASKPFAESYLLSEMFAQLLESRGIRVVRRRGLGSTEIVFAALRTGAVDVYPEYTGTGLLAILGQDPPHDRREAFREVSEAFRVRWGLRWLPPLGFENTYAIAVRRGTADSLGLHTLSDLARVSRNLVGGFSPDFMGRADGLPGLHDAYGLEMKSVRSLYQAVKYQALAQGEVDVIDGYGTDGRIERYDLVVLEDDRGFFPPYDAAPLVGRRVAASRPDVIAALSELGGMLDESTMRALNARVEVGGEDPAAVAADELAALGLVSRTPGDTASAPGSAATDTTDVSLVGYLWARRNATAHQTFRHLLLVLLSMAAGLLVALPLGLALERTPRGAEATIRSVGILQTIPSIALLAFMIPVLGIGMAPAVVALFLYSLLPMVRNTYTGVRDADPVAVEAARALGMTDLQLLLQVRLPLAAPVIMAGVRTAAVINVGTATLAAFIGAGGLGDPIVSGLALSDTRMILSGAIPAAVLALAVDGVLALAEKAVAPGGMGG